MAKIVAISGIGEPAPAPASALLVWAAILGAAGLIFWGTLRPVRRRRAA